MRVVRDLVALDLADREVARIRMREVEAAHRGGGQHREGFGELHVGVPPGVEQLEQVALLGVVGHAGYPGAGRIPAYFSAIISSLDRLSPGAYPQNSVR